MKSGRGGVGLFPFRHSPGHDLLFTRDARNSLCLLGDGRKTAGKRLGLATCLFSWPTSTVLPFFILANRLPPSPCPCTFLYVASSTLVCLLICLTCVSMMTQHKNSTKSEQNLKDKANSSNSNNIKQQQQQPKQQQHAEQHL